MRKKGVRNSSACGFLRVLRFPPPSKADRHDITEILLKVALNTIKQTNKQTKQKYESLKREIKNYFPCEFKTRLFPI
jgi:hypothetical protein